MLRHFGFVGVSCGLDDPHDAEVKGDYLDEVKGFTNLAHACALSPSQDISKLGEASKAAGVGLVLQVQPILFDSMADGSSPSGNRIRLRADARARWQAFSAKNPDLSAVSVLYPADEPHWNGCSPEELQGAFAILEETHPETVKLLIEAYAALDLLEVPAEVDWVGFDRYDTLKPREDEAYLADLAKVRAKKRAGQQVVLIMDTQWRPHYGAAGVKPEQMSIPAQSLFELAAASDDVVGIIGYLWPGGLDEPAQLGARDLPGSVQDVYRTIGKTIVGTP